MRLIEGDILQNGPDYLNYCIPDYYKLVASEDLMRFIDLELAILNQLKYILLYNIEENLKNHFMDYISNGTY